MKLSLLFISFMICTDVVAQQTVALKEVNSEFIHNDFLKTLSLRMLASDKAEEPILSTYGEKEFNYYYVTRLADYDDFSTDVMITTDRVNYWYANDEDEWGPVAMGIGKTHGDFMLVYILGEDGESSMGWLYTVSFTGGVIDSLEFYRVLHVDKKVKEKDSANLQAKTVKVSDLNSRLHYDLTITQSFIDWGESQSNFYPFVDRKGTRYDLTYTISSDGHFRCLSLQPYEAMTYSVEQLEISPTPNATGQYGIERGNEIKKSYLRASSNEWLNLIRYNRFPIYGHYYKEIPEGVNTERVKPQPVKNIEIQ